MRKKLKQFQNQKYPQNLAKKPSHASHVLDAANTSKNCCAFGVLS
jgi:hypothetical protein